jgi:hypothetical protein
VGIGLRGELMLSRKEIERNIDWLLNNDSVSTRYLTHFHLLGSDPRSKEMQELWKCVEEDPNSLEILSKQRADGSWCSGGSWAVRPSYLPKGGWSPVSPKYVTTVWILAILGDMGFDFHNEQVRRACEYTLKYQQPNGLMSERTDWSEESGSDPNPANVPCRMAIQLFGLAKVGMGKDQRLGKSFDLLKRWQREDGGWVQEGHKNGTAAPYKVWNRSCPWATYFATSALYYCRDPTHKDALMKGIDFLLWHLDQKRDSEIRRFFWHGHDTVRELLMFSETGIAPTQRSVSVLLNWLEGMYHPEIGCFRYSDKPLSKMKRWEDGASPTVAKYRFYHLIEDDWLTYYMARIESNFLSQRT